MTSAARCLITVPRYSKKIEEPFGWAKTVGGMAQTVHRGLDRVRA